MNKLELNEIAFWISIDGNRWKASHSVYWIIISHINNTELDEVSTMNYQVGGAYSDSNLRIFGRQ